MVYLSFETADDLRDEDLTASATTRKVLQSAPSAQVIIAVLEEAYALSDASLATAASVSPSAVRSWRAGKKPSDASWKRLQDLASVAAFLLTFSCFRTPAAAGRWMTMPRRASDEEDFVTVLDQIAAGDVERCADDAVEALSGPVEGARVTRAQRSDRSEQGSERTTLVC